MFPKSLPVILLLFSLPGKAQQPDSVKHLIDSTLHLMQQQSMYTKSVNWKNVYDSTYLLAGNAKTYEEAVPALRYAFDALHDHHGWLVINGKDYRNSHYIPDTNRINPATKATIAKGGKFYAGTIEKYYTYLSIPFFSGNSATGMHWFAQTLQDSLCKYSNTGTKGFIIDLRLNGGGNMYPMYAGIANLFSNGLIGSFIDHTGKETGNWSIKNNGVLLNDSILVQLERTCGNYSKFPVAVLTGPLTGSAGECIAFGLGARKNTRLFGETTAGFVTTNNGFLLPGTDNGIVLAVGLMKDHNGRIARENIKPDVSIIGGDNFEDRANDKKIQTALQWLKHFSK
ncbi:MAG: S41 family peptidase [Chitinophagaceae bacterium]